MTHYQKLATIIFRSVAVILMLLGAVAGLYGLAVSLAAGFVGFLISWSFSLPTIVFGIVLFGISTWLSRLVCKDFDDFRKS